MKVTVESSEGWLGHKKGANLNLKDSYAKQLVQRGVMKEFKEITKKEVDKEEAAELLRRRSK